VFDHPGLQYYWGCKHWVEIERKKTQVCVYRSDVKANRDDEVFDTAVEDKFPAGSKWLFSKKCPRCTLDSCVFDGKIVIVDNARKNGLGMKEGRVPIHFEQYHVGEHFCYANPSSLVRIDPDGYPYPKIGKGATVTSVSGTIAPPEIRGKEVVTIHDSGLYEGKVVSEVAKPAKSASKSPGKEKKNPNYVDLKTMYPSTVMNFRVCRACSAVIDAKEAKFCPMCGTRIADPPIVPLEKIVHDEQAKVPGAVRNDPSGPMIADRELRDELESILSRFGYLHRSTIEKYRVIKDGVGRFSGIVRRLRALARVILFGIHFGDDFVARRMYDDLARMSSMKAMLGSGSVPDNGSVLSDKTPEGCIRLEDKIKCIKTEINCFPVHRVIVKNTPTTKNNGKPAELVEATFPFYADHVVSEDEIGLFYVKQKKKDK
jgi:hypothetical protein